MSGAEGIRTPDPLTASQNWPMTPHPVLCGLLSRIGARTRTFGPKETADQDRRLDPGGA